MPTVEDAIALALEAHHGQVDRAGEPYILHPLRVMVAQQSASRRMIAVLHDVVENTPLTLDDLRARGYDEMVVGAVDSLSRREGESYETYIQRVRQNPLAVPVKLADLMDNMDLRRRMVLQDSDLERLRRYQNAWWELTRDTGG